MYVVYFNDFVIWVGNDVYFFDIGKEGIIFFGWLSGWCSSLWCCLCSRSWLNWSSSWSCIIFVIFEVIYNVFFCNVVICFCFFECVEFGRWNIFFLSDGMNEWWIEFIGIVFWYWCCSCGSLCSYYCLIYCFGSSWSSFLYWCFGNCIIICGNNGNYVFNLGNLVFFKKLFYEDIGSFGREFIVDFICCYFY